MTDPLREEAKDAIATCREAGIRSVMITGDQQITAAEIARQLGIDRDRNGQPLRTVRARELMHLDAAGWQETVKGAAVFARVSPKHKLQIVEALQAQGQIVAMTGDGVNDAPALRKADIGVAMGIKGTEVAKETADMVIVDLAALMHGEQLLGQRLSELALLAAGTKRGGLVEGAHGRAADHVEVVELHEARTGARGSRPDGAIQRLKHAVPARVVGWVRAVVDDVRSVAGLVEEAESVASPCIQVTPGMAIPGAPRRTRRTR